jgi:predicted nucleotidyltransferase
MADKRKLLAELKALLVANFGTDIKHVILFGSRVTGQAREDSDFDVLIVLNCDYDWQYRSRITVVIYELEVEQNVFIDAKVISINELQNTLKGKHPLYSDAIETGVYA